MKYSIRRIKDPALAARLQLEMEDEGLPVLDFEPRVWWHVIDSRKKSVGYAAMRINGRYAWFSVCAVFPKARRKGLQKRLLSARITHARRQGCKVAYTYTVNGNHPSQRALISRGFKTCDPPEEHYGKWAGDEDVIYWKKEL